MECEDLIRALSNNRMAWLLYNSLERNNCSCKTSHIPCMLYENTVLLNLIPKPPSSLQGKESAGADQRNDEPQDSFLMLRTTSGDLKFAM